MSKSEFNIRDFSAKDQETFERADSSQKAVLEEKLQDGFKVVRMDRSGTILIHKGFYCLAIIRGGTAIPC